MRAFENGQIANLRVQQSCAHRYRENGTLLTAGFKRTGHGLLWERDGVYYGREAALQKARQEQRFNT